MMLVKMTSSNGIFLARQSFQVSVDHFTNFKACSFIWLSKRLVSDYYGFCSSFTKSVVMFKVMSICVELFWVNFFQFSGGSILLKEKLLITLHLKKQKMMGFFLSFYRDFSFAERYIKVFQLLSLTRLAINSQNVIKYLI